MIQIDISSFAGWSLAGAGLVALAAAGRLDWLLVLVPVSLIVSYGWMRLSEDRNKLTSTMKKR
jgi:hypothetical protein